MKFASFERGSGETGVAAVTAAGLVDLGPVVGDGAGMIDVIRSHAGLGPELAAYLRRAPAALPLPQVRLRPPVMPGKILCSGLNYRSHVEENPSARFLDDPRFFAKTPNTVIGPGEAIEHPGESYAVDYEVELGVVIGPDMPAGTPADAIGRHIFGYTILHDVSARYIQFKDNNETMGKNFDTFCPLGPWIVTADEVGAPETLRLRTFLNGRLLQDGSNEDWCFPLPRLLAWLSQAMTLHAGDVVSTGTPAGIGWFRRPQVFLRPGDTVRLEIDRIGALENPVRRRPAPSHAG